MFINVNKVNLRDTNDAIEAMNNVVLLFASMIHDDVDKGDYEGALTHIEPLKYAIENLKYSLNQECKDGIDVYRVIRQDDEVDVAILPNKEDGKYSFVNLTNGHICKCKFDSVNDALADMNKQMELGNVVTWKKIG